MMKDLTAVLLNGKNVEILLYLAKYTHVTKKEIESKLGGELTSGISELEQSGLIKTGEFLTLTNKGIFQVDGLVGAKGFEP